MKIVATFAVAFTAGLASISFGDAEVLRYRGKAPGTAAGTIELGAQRYVIEPGAEIPGWGRVKEVADTYLIVEHVLTEAEKNALEQHGALVHDVTEIHIPREDLRQMPLPPLRR